MQDRKSYNKDNRNRSGGDRDGYKRSYNSDDNRRSASSGSNGNFRKRKNTEGRPLSAGTQFDKKRLDPNAELRLNKYLSETGACSRRKADELIQEGKVKVNGKVVNELGAKVKRTDFITVNGDPVKNIIRLSYILLNKPKDYISTVTDDRGRKTIMDLVKSSDRLYPVGRLDRNTTGIILLTNDGELAFRLTHPKYEVSRTYKVVLDRPLKAVDAEAISAGVELEDDHTAPCEIVITPSKPEELYITLIEGKNREIRRIFEKFGYEVKRLDRKTFGTLNSSGLARGQYRNLDRMELLALKRLVKMI